MPIACVKKAEELVSITLPDDGDDTIPFGELVKKVLTLEPYLGALICEITHPDNARKVPDSLKKHFEKGGFYFEINELMLKAEGVINRIMYDRKRFWDESRPSPSESREDSFKRHIEAVLKREDPRINLQFLTKVAPILRPALEPFFSGDTFQDPQKEMWNAVKKKEDLPEEGAGSPDSLGLLALFPPEGEPIRIEQGRVGNCALLASLDAMLHSDEGRKLIASMFHYTDTGSLEVRIKTNRYTHHLLEKMDMGQLEGKYEFRQESGYDVFTISPERLRDINRTSSHGVTSNALIVKVLERVSSYYYSTPLGVDSVMAHNERGKFTTSDIDFMSQLFGGINIHHIPIQPGEGFEEAAENLMERSKINPIYVTMDFSHMVKGDSTKHSRHALRIESVEKDSTGQWIITLINPWDTSKPVSYSLTELLSKYRAEFSVFHVDKISKSTNKQSEEILSYLHQKPAPPPLPVPVHHVGGGGGGGGGHELLVDVAPVVLSLCRILYDKTSSETPAKLAELLQREFDNRRITIKQISESTVAAKYFSSGPLQSAMLCLLAKDILGEKNSEDKWPKKEELWEQEVRRPGILAKIFANKLGPFNLSWANLRTDLPGILPDISNHFTSGRFQAAYERHLDSPVAKVIADMRQKLQLGRLLEWDRLGAKNIEKKPPGT